MRVAYVCCDPGVPVFGSKGCSVHVQEVARELIRRGCQVDLIAPRTGGEPKAELAEVRYHPIQVRGRASHSDREQAQIKANQKVLDLLAKLGPVDLIYERYSLYSFAGMQYAKATGTPGILEVNSPLIQEQARYRQLEDRDTAEEMTWRAMTTASAVVAVSEQVAEYVRSFRSPSYRKSHHAVHVIPNGVDISRFADCDVPREPSEDGTLTLGFVGTLKQWHGVADLIEAYQKLGSVARQVRLLIVGDGPERARLEQQTARLPPHLARQVLFTGAVDADQISALLAKMDVAVAPYGPLTDFYFSPLKIFEYMAAGLPTVVSRVGQIPALIQDDVTGLLYAAGNTGELAKALVALLENSKLRLRLGRAAQRQVAESSTWEAVVSQILAVAADLPDGSQSTSQPHFGWQGEKTLKYFTP